MLCLFRIDREIKKAGKKRKAGDLKDEAKLLRNLLTEEQPEVKQEEEERDLLLAKPEPNEGGGGPCGAAGTAPPPPQPAPTTSRRNRLVRSHRIAEVKEEKDDYNALAPPKLGKRDKI